MFARNKLLIGIVAATLAIIAAGVFIFSKQSSTPPSAKKVDEKLLIRNDSQKVASDSANVTLVEFSDYQCPACGSYYPLVKQLMTEFSGKLNFVYRNFPLSQHKNAKIAAYAAEAAGNQGKFWEMHDMIFENQSKWSESEDAKSIFVQYAKDLKLDTNRFNQDLSSDKIKQKVDRDTSDGFSLAVNSTPTFYLNAEKITNPASYEDFKTQISAAIANTQIAGAVSEKYHTHFDLKVYINGKAVDFSQAKYQSSEKNELDPDIHFHDGNGKVVHIHKEGVPLKALFDSLKITIPTGTLAYVNGKKVEDILSYVPGDLDQILIGSSILSSVSNDACIYSEKCPERGKPPEENCVGGLGTNCD